METVTFPSQSFVPNQQVRPKRIQYPEDSLVCKLEMNDRDKNTLAEFAGAFAAIFTLIQIASILYEIFILEQRLLDPDEKTNHFLMILFCAVKIIYTMVLVFYLFILSPSNISGVKIASFAIAAVQLGVSIYLIIKEIDAYKHPPKPQNPKTP
jgi:hypothetical protein